MEAAGIEPETRAASRLTATGQAASQSGQDGRNTGPATNVTPLGSAHERPTLVERARVTGQSFAPNPPQRSDLALAPDLASVVSAWPTLTEPVKAGILAMISAATKSTGR